MLQNFMTEKNAKEQQVSWVGLRFWPVYGFPADGLMGYGYEIRLHNGRLRQVRRARRHHSCADGDGGGVEPLPGELQGHLGQLGLSRAQVLPQAAKYNGL